MTEKVSGKVKLFNEELNKVIRKLSSQYGYYMPDFSLLEHDGNLHLNLSLFSKEPDLQYAEWFNLYAEKLGMKKEWLNNHFTSPDSGKKMQIKGLDIEGGERCVRTIDENGNSYHYSPNAIVYLINNYAKI